MRTLIAAGCLAVAIIAAAPPVFAASNPSDTGPPNQSCQSFSATTRPGHRGNSPGSVFNEPGINSQNGGTGGNAYNNAGAPSQYDVACYQQSQH